VILDGKTFGKNGVPIHEWRSPIPFNHLEIGDAIIFQVYANDIFQTDGGMRPKGVIEVLL
jgi:hypothetical protein